MRNNRSREVWELYGEARLTRRLNIGFLRIGDFGVYRLPEQRVEAAPDRILPVLQVIQGVRMSKHQTNLTKN
jgi:hypothetical protein